MLDAGGGIGAVEIELLKAGAARSTVVELSPGYERVAADLAREAGVADRLDRHVGDFAEDGTEPADVVVLHRVVCCYPDYEALVAAAAAKRGRRSCSPIRRANLVHAGRGVGLVNLWLPLRGMEFRTFVHPPRTALRGRGKRRPHRRRGRTTARSGASSASRAASR